MTTLLIAEDDLNIQKLLVRLLKQAGYETLVANDGQEALATLEDYQVDLLVLDVMMPKMTGFEVIKELRPYNRDLPIILVTAKESVADKKRGFLAGADDYMVKPINEEEFLLRIQALLRRAKIMTEQTVVINQTTLNKDNLTVSSFGEEVELPQKEFLLLFKLLANPNKIFTRLQLMADIWERDSETDSRTVDTHIKKLRKRFEGNSDFSIMTIRGLGYKAVKHEEKSYS
ncbi:response regulator transcription factor [Vagococcus salmoninarum]|uniref:response regulator transcription factor n=1 Tax=Vagococcus salmoninarum TaxID=2739 RepID=UPI0018820A12|nr:response regulator transcription factor [Vagococcus salmoninarum]MBE9388313.1 response regulator transcription factor [Vagococcus salmoninarum]